jgi:hypothetical protein
VKFANQNAGVIEWKNVNLQIPWFWQSLDLKQTQVKYQLDADLGDNKGTLHISGLVNRNAPNIDITAEVDMRSIDLNVLHNFNTQLVPVKQIFGACSLTGSAVYKNNGLNMPFTVVFKQLAIEYFENQKKLYGLKRELIDELISATKGDITLQLTVTGALQNPQVNTQELASQVIKQYLMKSQEQSIEKKAKRYGEYLQKKIFKN